MAASSKASQGPTKTPKFNAQRDRRNEVIVKVSPDYRWSVYFSQTDDFREPYCFSNKHKAVKGTTERTFELDGTNAKIRIRDAAVLTTRNSKKNKDSQTRCRAVFEIFLSDCKNINSRPDDDHWLITIELAKQLAAPVLSWDPSQSTFPQNVLVGEHIPLWNDRATIQQARFIIFMLSPYKQVTRWDVGLVTKILSGQLTRTAEVMCRQFIELQKNAIMSDDKEKEDILKSLGRQCKVEVVANPNSPQNPNVFLHSGKHWALQQGLDVNFESKQFIPSNAPPFHQPGEGGGWQIAVERKQGDLWVGTFNNKLPQDCANWMTTNKTFSDVKAVVSSKDCETRKLLAAIQLLDLRLRIELKADISQFSPENVSAMRLVKIPVLKILMSHFKQDFGSDLDKSLAFRDPAQTMFRLDAFEKYGQPIDNDRQRSFLRQTLNSSLIVCQGPPGTGKTTLVGSVVCLAYRQTNVLKIMLTAHSNVAVEVMVERVAEQMRDVFGMDPRDHICLIRTDPSAFRIAASGRNVPEIVQSLFLESHIDRLVKAQPWAKAYRAGRDEIRKFGHIYDDLLKKAYMNARMAAYTILQSKVRIWACTLSTTTHPILVGPKDARVDPKCDLLVMDEASQATTPYEMQAWLNLNPTRLVVVGDHEQLTPYTKTLISQEAWSRPMIQQLIERKYPCLVLLNVQYRHPIEIGNSISQTFYNGQVRPHPSCIRKEWVADFFRRISRISFRDSTGKTQRLSRNVHFFAIQNGVCETGDGSSSFNMAEVSFISGLVRAFEVVGVKSDTIMALTGYLSQQGKLSNALKGTKVSVRIVESSQGDQNDIVILSAVRTGKNIGFLSNSHRLCVGGSRAKNAEFLVAHEPTLRVDGKWRTYLDTQCRDQGKNVWRFSVHTPVTWYIDNQPLQSQTPSTVVSPPRNVVASPSPWPRNDSQAVVSPSRTVLTSHAHPTVVSPARNLASATANLAISPRPTISTSTASSPATSLAEARVRLQHLNAIRPWAENAIKPVLFAAWDDGVQISGQGAMFAQMCRGSPIALSQAQIIDVYTYYRLKWEDPSQW